MLDLLKSRWRVMIEFLTLENIQSKEIHIWIGSLFGKAVHAYTFRHYACQDNPRSGVSSIMLQIFWGRTCLQDDPSSGRSCQQRKLSSY